eukprot:46563_1
MTDNPKGKTNSWSRSKSVDLEFDATPQPETETEPKKDEPESNDPAYVAPEMTDNPKGKTNSWSRSKSVDLKLEDDDAKKTPKYPTPPTGPLYIMSPSKKWRGCSIAEVLEDGAKWKIHYTGFSSKHDEIVDSTTDRVTNKDPGNVVPKKKKQPKKKKAKKTSGDVAPKPRIWCQSAKNKDIYRECEVVEEKEDQIKVHFVSYHEKYDCWLERKSDRLSKQRPRGNELIKGDNMSAWSGEFKGWLEAEVVAVNDDQVQISWVGNNDLPSIWLPSDSPKLSVSHKKHNAPPPSS